MWLNYTFWMIHTLNVESPSRVCKLWCTSSRLSPVNQTGSVACYPADCISADPPPRRLRSQGRSAKPRRQNTWSPDGYTSQRSPNECHCVPGRDFQCNVSNCSRCALRTSRQRQRGDKVWRLICRSHNKGSPIIFPIRKTQSKSEWAAFPACHCHKPPAPLVYISDFQLHQQRSWLFVPKTVPQVWDDILWEESPHHVSFSHAFIVRQGGKAFTTVLYRILGVSVWPSPCVITRFAGCEQASQQDAPVRLFPVTVRKQAVANKNRALTEERKKY